MDAKILQKKLEKYSNIERKKSNECFFKTGKGDYGEGDIFMGVSMPNIRKVIKEFKKLHFEEIKKLLSSRIHEVRMAGVLILTENAKIAYKKGDDNELKKISDFYLDNRKGINNWDLVDVSCHYILGNAIFKKIYGLILLDKLASSNALWDKRIAMVSTYAFIKKGDIFPTLVLAKKLLFDKEDLIHKAIGWMLRESWKRESAIIEEFLLENYRSIPRTTLRYAIEKMEENKRKEFLHLRNN